MSEILSPQFVMGQDIVNISLAQLILHSSSTSLWISTASFFLLYYVDLVLRDESITCCKSGIRNMHENRPFQQSPPFLLEGLENSEFFSELFSLNFIQRKNSEFFS
jgi:hypothetical protein